MSRSLFRTTLVAALALIGASLSSAAFADSGTIRINVLKGGWFIGASGGSGTLTFRGRTYPLSIGGLSACLVFGASQTYLSGRVSRINSPGDVAGVYGAGGAGAAVGRGGEIKPEVAVDGFRPGASRPTLRRCRATGAAHLPEDHQ